MIYKVKLTTIGNSVGIVLPKELISNLHVGKGDNLIIAETENGFKATCYDDEYIAQMRSGEKIARKYKNALRALAKEENE